MSNFKYSVRDITETALFVAIAILLDLPFLKMKIVANGGSISLNMLPLMILSFRKGIFKGFVGCGIVYGLLTCLFDGYGFITYPLDYLLGFGVMCICGLFREHTIGTNGQFKIGHFLLALLLIVISCAARVLFSTISGIAIYGLNFVESLVYQLSYMGFSCLACLVAFGILYKPLLMIEKRFPNTN